METSDDLQYLAEGVFDPGIFKAVFVVGGSGSGKSFSAKLVIPGRASMRPLNSDDVLEWLLKRDAREDLFDMTKLSKNDEAAKEQLRKEGKRVSTTQGDRIIAGKLGQGKLGLVIDGTGKEPHKVEVQKRVLEKAGYDTFMIWVDTPLDVARGRNLKRAKDAAKGIQRGSVAQDARSSEIKRNFGKEGKVLSGAGKSGFQARVKRDAPDVGRAVPDFIVVQSNKAVRDNEKKFRSMFGANFARIDGSGTGGDQSVSLPGKGFKSKKIPVGADVPKITKQVQKFIDKPIKSPVAKAWIRASLLLKNADPKKAAKSLRVKVEGVMEPRDLIQEVMLGVAPMNSIGMAGAGAGNVLSNMPLENHPNVRKNEMRPIEVGEATELVLRSISMFDRQEEEQAMETRRNTVALLARRGFRLNESDYDVWHDEFVEMQMRNAEPPRSEEEARDRHEEREAFRATIEASLVGVGIDDEGEVSTGDDFTVESMIDKVRSGTDPSTLV